MEAANFIARQLKQFGQLSRKPSDRFHSKCSNGSDGSALKCSLFSIKRAVIEHDVFMSMTTSRIAEGVACLSACLSACLPALSLLPVCLINCVQISNATGVHYALAQHVYAYYKRFVLTWYLANTHARQVLPISSKNGREMWLPASQWYFCHLSITVAALTVQAAHL